MLQTTEIMSEENRGNQSKALSYDSMDEDLVIIDMEELTPNQNDKPAAIGVAHVGDDVSGEQNHQIKIASQPSPIIHEFGHSVAKPKDDDEDSWDNFLFDDVDNLFVKEGHAESVAQVPASKDDPYSVAKAPTKVQHQNVQDHGDVALDIQKHHGRDMKGAIGDVRDREVVNIDPSQQMNPSDDSDELDKMDYVIIEKSVPSVDKEMQDVASNDIQQMTVDSGKLALLNAAVIATEKAALTVGVLKELLNERGYEPTHIDKVSGDAVNTWKTQYKDNFVASVRVEINATLGIPAELNLISHDSRSCDNKPVGRESDEDSSSVVRGNARKSDDAQELVAHAHKPDELPRFVVRSKFDPKAREESMSPIPTPKRIKFTKEEDELLLREAKIAFAQNPRMTIKDAMGNPFAKLFIARHPMFPHPVGSIGKYMRRTLAKQLKILRDQV